MDPKEIFAKMVEEGAADLFIKTGAKPHIKNASGVFPLDFPEIDKETANKIYNDIATDRVKRIFDEEGAADSAYEIEGVGRFRTNIYTERGQLAFCFRHVKGQIPDLADLKLPAETLQKLISQRRGLVCVTGVTGSGKSTTLASMIKHVNTTQHRHIITIEDPIEFLFKDDQSIIEQRELGVDTFSFSNALKHVVRESPDIIMIGEMRDMETVAAAFKAAETGHLVISTLHTVNAMQTIDRIINFFPPHQHNFLRQQMSLLMKGIVSMRLIKGKDGKTRVPAVEIMTETPTIRDLLAEGKTSALGKAMKESSYYGCQTFNQSLASLVKEGHITEEEAVASSDSPDDLKLELRGINKGGGGDFNFKI